MTNASYKLRIDNQRGFSLVEATTSLVVLAVAILGLTATSARLTQVTAEAENRALALQVVEDRISMIRLHPVYQELDSLFSETGSEIPELPTFTRSTSLSRIRQPQGDNGRYLDYTRITVTVSGPGLNEPVSRTVAVGVS
jgi:type II secretory pathway pseudopilin PulG